MPTPGAGPYQAPTYPLAQAPTFDMGLALGGVGGVTGTQVTPDTFAQNFKGVTVVVDLTVNAGALGSLVVTVQGKDSASGKYFPLLTSGALSTVGTYVFTIYPGITAAASAANAGASVSSILPAWFRVQVAGNANPTTYTVGVVLTT